MTLADSRHEVVAVLTREDSVQGRHRVMTPTAVAAAASGLGLPVVKANRLDAAATDAIASFEPELGVVVAYGSLLREPLLSLPRLGWINLHFSLLPRWRGAAPVQRAIIAGDDITGASVFQLVPELDAGALYGQFTQTIKRRETAGQLLESLAQGGAELLGRVVDALADGTARAEPQAGDVTLAPKLALRDGQIDWGADAQTVGNLIRGVTPEPGAFTTAGDVRLGILEAVRAHDASPLPPGEFAWDGKRVLVGTATEPIALLRVHPAGRKAMAAADWWRGRFGKEAAQ